jgi:hypothetical protein
MRPIKSAQQQQQQKHNHQSKLHFSTSPSVANKMFAKKLQRTAVEARRGNLLFFFFTETTICAT